MTAHRKDGTRGRSPDPPPASDSSAALPADAATATPLPLDAVAATRKQIRGSSALLSGRVISLLANLLIQVLIVRALSIGDFGAFAYALSFTTAARIVVTLGHSRTITRFLAIYEERREYDRLFGALVMEVGIILSMGGAILGAAWLAQGWLSRTAIDDPRAITVLLIILVLVPIEALDDLVEAMFAVFARPRAIFMRKYVVAPVLRLSAVLLMILVGSNVVFLAIGYVTASALGVALYGSMLLRVLRERELLQHFNRRTLSMPFREVFGFSFPLLSTELVVISMSTFSMVLLGYFGGASSVAAYRVIRPVAVLNHFVWRSFSLLFMPLASRLYARGDSEGMREAYWRTAVWLAVFTFPIFAMTVVFAEPVVVTLFGERYRDSAVYLSLLAFGYYFNVTLGFNAMVLQVFGRLRYLVGVNVLAALMNVALSFWLIPRHGVLGVAYANAGTLLAQNMLNQAGLGRGIGIGIFSVRYLRVYVTIVLTAAALWLLNSVLAPGIVLSVSLSAVASLVVYGVNRHELKVADTFPELLQVPFLRRLVT